VKSREYVYKDKTKALCLMDIATIAMKEFKKKGMLEDLDTSDEKNACSIGGQCGGRREKGRMAGNVQK
jgi:phosphoribosylformylglycinamidine synthase